MAVRTINETIPVQLKQPDGTIKCYNVQVPFDKKCKCQCTIKAEECNKKQKFVKENCACSCINQVQFVRYLSVFFLVFTPICRKTVYIVREEQQKKAVAGGVRFYIFGTIKLVLVIVCNNVTVLLVPFGIRNNAGKFEFFLCNFLLKLSVCRCRKKTEKG